MNIRAIGGLFETHAALQYAMQELSLHGYQHYAYSIIGTAGAPPIPPNGQNQGLMRALTRLGLGGKQAEYYVDGIQRGGVLLVLHGVEAHKLPDVQQVLQQQGAKFAR
jgi:hypothetical protein